MDDWDQLVVGHIFIVLFEILPVELFPIDPEDKNGLDLESNEMIDAK